MKTFPTLFTQEKNRKRGAIPVWILKMPFASTGTLFLSDNEFTIASWESGITTKALIADWGGIDENISFGVGSPSVSTFKLNLISSQNESPNIAAILDTPANNINTITCELYLWWLGLSAVTDPPELMWSGNIVDYRAISSLVYEVECSDESTKYNKILGNLLNTTTYTSLPDTSVGKVAPIIYGSVKKHRPICISSGGFSRLAEDLDTSETSIDLIDASSFASSGYTINVNGEIMTVTGKSGNTLTVTRSSTPAAHSIDDPVVQITTITYMIADHPIKALNHVYVDNVEITTGYTLYTGQTGSQHPTYPNKAILVVANAMPAAYDEVVQVDAAGASGTGWGTPANVCDENESTYANCVYDNQTLTVTFDVPSTPIFGNIKQQRVNLKWTGNPDTTTISVYHAIGGTSVGGYSGPLHTFDGNTVIKTGGSASDNFTLYATGVRDGDHDGWIYCYEVRYKEITYATYNSSGETCEEVIVGGDLTVDVDGYQDDASGTWTGTANALIVRPDYIIKHLLYTYLSVPSAKFFTDTATPFAADSYAFGVCINEQKTAKAWLAKMAWECRSYFRFAAGLAQLLYRPGSLTSDKTIAAGMIERGQNGETTLLPELTPLDEVINNIRCRYDRDWSLTGDDAYAGLYETSDATSITRYGEKEKPDLFNLDFITSSTMAQDVAAFYLARYKNRKKIITMGLFLDNAELEFAGAVTIAPLANLLCEVQKVNEQPGSAVDMRNDKITLVAKEY